MASSAAWRQAFVTPGDRVYARATMTRFLLVRLHRYVGLAIAGFLALAGLTGSLIAFQPELDAWLNPRFFHAETVGAPLPLDRLVAAVESQDRRVFASFIQPATAPGSTALVTVEPRVDATTRQPFQVDYNQVFVDPVSGSVQGKRLYGALPSDTAHLMPFIVMLHYSLHLPDRWGDLALGIVAIAWLLDCFVGLYLTLPARLATQNRTKPWWPRWQPAWRVKWSASRLRVHFDLHRAGGLWLWGLLLVLALSSIAMNLRHEVFIPTVQLVAPVTAEPLDLLPRVESATPVLGWDAAIDSARQHVPALARQWSVAGVYLASELNAYEVTLVEHTGHDSVGRLGRERVVLHAGTGERLANHSYDDGTAADKFLSWQYPLHSGQIAGVPGRIVVCLLGLAVFGLSLTGVVIWWSKRQVQRSRSVRRHASSVATRLGNAGS